LVVSWGASARPSLGAVLKAREDGEKIGFFRPITVHPFPEKRFRRLAKGARVVIVPEMNLGQLILEVERFINDDIELIGVNRIGGVPLTVTEILKAIKRVI
jgi:2-oxoglutarate ferredoxin oxidoreductase subunit alpha